MQFLITSYKIQEKCFFKQISETKKNVNTSIGKYIRSVENQQTQVYKLLHSDTVDDKVKKTLVALTDLIQSLVLEV